MSGRRLPESVCRAWGSGGVGAGWGPCRELGELRKALRCPRSVGPYLPQVKAELTLLIWEQLRKHCDR